MFEAFSLKSIEANLKNKQIVITTSLDIDSFEMISSSINVIDKESKELSTFEYVVNGKELIITLDDYPIPNKTYRLTVRNLKSITGESLTTSINRNIVFKSSVLTEARLISPAMFEKVKDVKIELEEFIPSSASIDGSQDIMINSYYIEIAKDNHFYAPIIKAPLSKSEVELELAPGQYYIRARVETSDGEHYGIWSETSTFIKGDIEESGELPDIIDPEEPIDPDDPIIDLEDFTITTNLENGVTLNKIVITLNKEIKEGTAPSVIVKRKTIEHSNVIVLEDNKTIEITLSEGFKDDSIYQIAISAISFSDDILEEVIDYYTKTTYMYIDVLAVKTIIGDLSNIPDSVIMYNIREASKYAEYVAGYINEESIPFEVTQFVKYKAAYECLLRHSVSLSSSLGMGGKVGNVSFEERQTTKDIRSLLENLSNLIKQWLDEVKGYKLEGRAPMNYGVRGSNASPRFSTIGSIGSNRGFF